MYWFNDEQCMASEHGVCMIDGASLYVTFDLVAYIIFEIKGHDHVLTLLTGKSLGTNKA